MKIKTFSQIGKRSNNEDNLGYNERLLMVCDGVGGHVSGEIASKFVIDNMLSYFQTNVPDLNKIGIQHMLDEVQTSLNHVLDKDPMLEKMGSTFTGIFFTDKKWYLAHIGDSRIYMFRPSESKLWFTRDHSLVGELMAHHEITREEGRFHPMSNRISKAIIANFENKIQSASITAIDEVKPGDIFLLCSDGLVEAWGDHELIDLFSNTQLTFAEKCQKLQLQCKELSKDNNTAIIAEVDAEDAFSCGSNEEIQWVTFQEIKDDYAAYLAKQTAVEPVLTQEPRIIDMSDIVVSTQTPDPKPVPATGESKPPVYVDHDERHPRSNHKLMILLGILILLVGVLAGMLLLKSKNNKPAENGKGKEEQVEQVEQVKKSNEGDAEPASVEEQQKTDLRNTIRHKRSDASVKVPEPRTPKIQTEKEQPKNEAKTSAEDKPGSDQPNLITPSKQNEPESDEM